MNFVINLIIPVEESSEFLAPVDVAPPPTMNRYQDSSGDTPLFPVPNAATFTYNRVPWKLTVRKEVFSPNEKLSNPLAVHLVFCQVVKDVLGGGCIRITREQGETMKKVGFWFEVVFRF